MEERVVNSKGGQTAETPQFTLCLSWLLTAQGAQGCAASRGSMVGLHAGSQRLALATDFVTWTSSSVALPLVMIHDLLQEERAAKMTNFRLQILRANQFSLCAVFPISQSSSKEAAGQKEAKRTLFIPQSSVCEMCLIW